jgi:hypothetical protein
MGDFKRVTKKNPCPICGAISYCSFNEQIAICTRVEKGSIKACRGKVPQWIHRLTPGQVAYERPREVINCMISSTSVRNLVYRAFLGKLTLNSTHRQALLKRGLTSQAIDERGYRSMPIRGRSVITEKLRRMGCELTGIPGFYQRDGQGGSPYWTFVGRAGLIIPVSDTENQIAGLRIRLDEPDVNEHGREKNKYRWVSSAGLPLGTSSGVFLHFAKGNNDRVLWVTEGEIKADIIALMKGYDALSIPGVDLWPMALSFILKKGYRYVIVALDMDKYFPKHERVLNAEVQLVKGLRAEQIQVAVAEWNLDFGKGVDDLFVGGHNPNYIIAA